MPRLRARVASLVSALEFPRTLGLAAQMSFWLFLALVPLLAVAGLVAARVAVGNTWLVDSLLASAPPAARDMVTDQVARVASWRGGTVAPIAIATFVWFASSGVHAVLDALEEQAGASRAWWKKRVLALGACVVLSVGTAVLALLGTGVAWVGTLAHRARADAFGGAEWGALGTGARAIAGIGIAVVMTAGLFAAGTPRVARGRVAVWPGATVAVALQAALGWGYGVYVAKFGSGGAYQAGLAVVGVTLTTLWLFSVALLLGARLNRIVGERRLPARQAWPRSAASSSPPTSPRPRTGRSTGPSISPPASARPSR